MPPDLRLDADHRYWLDGRELLGATRMLAEVGLIDPRWYTDEACLRGTYVHQAIEWDLLGTLDEATLDPRLIGYLEAARRFLADSKSRVVAVERNLADPLRGIAGTPDLMGYVFDKPAVVDWKSGGKERWHRYQLAIYEDLMRTNTVLPEPLLKRFAVYLREDGTYTSEELTDRTDRAVAQAVITIAQAKRAA